MTPADLPPGFPSEAAIKAAQRRGHFLMEVVCDRHISNSEMLLNNMAQIAGAAIAADWPLLRAVAIREAVAALTLEPSQIRDRDHLERALLAAVTPDA